MYVSLSIDHFIIIIIIIAKFYIASLDIFMKCDANLDGSGASDTVIWTTLTKVRLEDDYFFFLKYTFVQNNLADLLHKHNFTEIV